MDGDAFTHGLRIALLAGGDSAEREISLASGSQTALALALAGHEPVLMDPAEINLAAIDWPAFDVCFVALHGGAGEDGRIQHELEQWGVPYTGSGPATSGLAMSKSAAKARFAQCGVPTPPSVVFSAAEFRRYSVPGSATSNGTGFSSRLGQQLAALGFPLVIKPEGQGSSLGISVAAGVSDLPRSVAVAATFDDLIMAEPFVTGREITISLLGRDPLPMIEIVAPQRLFTYDAKYSNPKTEYRLDARLPAAVEAELYRTAISAAEALGTAGLVRVDIILDHHHQPWVLEVNTIPGMTARSLAPRAARGAGIEMPALVDWMVRDARQRWKHGHDEKRTTPAEPVASSSSGSILGAGRNCRKTSRKWRTKQ
ncbi:MAG TPA: D-alanine--D-alanine ligase [Pirellulales bacterium]|nr:D-alanine--D-alanine ligase [Pirellulales bacterium]